MSGKPHIYEIDNLFAKNIGIIHRINYLFPRNGFRSLFCPILSTIYWIMLLFWGVNKYSSNFNKVFTLQKKIIRIVHNVPSKIDRKPLYHEGLNGWKCRSHE